MFPGETKMVMGDPRFRHEIPGLCEHSVFGFGRWIVKVTTEDLISFQKKADDAFLK